MPVSRASRFGAATRTQVVAASVPFLGARHLPTAAVTVSSAASANVGGCGTTARRAHTTFATRPPPGRVYWKRSRARTAVRVDRMIFYPRTGPSSPSRWRSSDRRSGSRIVRRSTGTPPGIRPRHSRRSWSLVAAGNCGSRRDMLFDPLARRPTGTSARIKAAITHTAVALILAAAHLPESIGLERVIVQELDD